MELRRHPSLWIGAALGLMGLLAVGACGAIEGKGGSQAQPASPDAPVKVFVDTSTLKPAPDFKVVTLDGEPRSLADYKGKVVILNFWATWCGPCRAEIPSFNRLYEAYGNQGLEIVGLSLDQGGRKDVEPFARAKKIVYPMLLGNNAMVTAYGGVRGIPTTFVLTQDHKVYKKYVGARAHEVFESDIRALLGLGPREAGAEGAGTTVGGR